MPQLKKYPYSDILGWSVSRFDKFSTCKRMYYYDYYAKRNDTEVDKKLLEELRNLTTRAMEAGNIIHDILKDVLNRLIKDPKPIDHEKLRTYALKKAEDYCNSKKFLEVYYGSMEAIDVDEIKSKITLYLNNLLSSDRYRWLLEHALPAAKEWLVEPDGFGETRIDGMKAYCKVDFLIPLNGKIYILDWKTGKEDEEKQTRQMKGYTTFACDHFQVKAEDVTCILVFLRDNKEVVRTFSTEDIALFRDSIREETEMMYKYNTSIESNTPKSKVEFSMTENKRLCDHCNYKKLCAVNFDF